MIAPHTPSVLARLPWRRCGPAALLLLCLFTFFFRLGSISLFDLDEGLYIACARQMVLSGDIVTPRLNTRPPDRPGEPPRPNAVPFYEKPILVYWAAAASLRLFRMSPSEMSYSERRHFETSPSETSYSEMSPSEMSPWAARLPSACAALLTTWITAVIGRRWFGQRAGLLAGAVYALAPLIVADARQMTTDGLLVLWLTVALFAFYRCYRERAGQTSGARKRAALLFWAMCALAVLTKGVIGLLLPALILGLFLLLPTPGTRRFRFAEVRAGIRALRPLVGLPLFLLIVVPWHVAIWKAGGHDAQGRTWVQEYVIRQHIGRFKGLDTVHNARFPTYLLYFLVGFFPWACFVPAAFRFRTGEERLEDKLEDKREESLKEERLAGESLLERHRFLLIWFWTVFVFFSLGAAKLPNYIQPAYPAAALLVGRWLDRAMAEGSGRTREDGRSLQRGVLAAAVTAGLLLGGAILAPRFAPVNSPVPPNIVRAALHLLLTLCVGCVVASCCAWATCAGGIGQWAGMVPARLVTARMAAVGSLALTMLAVVGIGSTEGYTVAEQEVLGPYQRLASAANADAPAGRLIVYYHFRPRCPSMNFYADYAPLETDRTPLLPLLYRSLTPTRTPAQSEPELILSRRTWDSQLAPELAANPDVSAQVLAAAGRNAGGWLLVRLHLAPR